MPVWLQIALACASPIGLLVGAVALIVTMRSNVARSQDDLRRISDKESHDDEEFHKFVVDIQSFIARQTEINQSVAGLLNSLSDRIDGMIKQAVEQPLINKQVADSLASVTSRLEAVSKSSTESVTVINLLSDILRDKRGAQ